MEFRFKIKSAVEREPEIEVFTWLIVAEFCWACWGAFSFGNRSSTQVEAQIIEVGVMSHAQIRHIVLGCLASFSLFIIMFNLCACNFCENRHTLQKFRKVHNALGATSYLNFEI